MKNKKNIILLSILSLLISGSIIVYHLMGERYPTVNTVNVSDKDNSVNDEDNTAKNQTQDFTVLDSQGNQVKLSDMFGKPIVLNFWASWCPPCKAEMPEFNEAYKEFDVIFMMVNLTDGSRETIESAKKYVDSKGFEFPLYFDSEQSAANAYSITSIPTTYFIDSNGELISYVVGQIDETTLKTGIENILPKEENVTEYQKITQLQAYETMQQDPNCIILDVRTVNEFEEGHIKNAKLLPVDELIIRAAQELPDKNSKILVYCRSGNRSATAAIELIEMGYTDVSDFGGIIDWEYETE